jgi:hypothetical protein
MKFFYFRKNGYEFNFSFSRIEQGPDPINQGKSVVFFYKEDMLHNIKNAAVYFENGKKIFFFKNKLYFQNFYVKDNPFYTKDHPFYIRDNVFNEKINKSYWRRFVKLQVFL